ncbi:SDR family oxidoreductase [Kitasatospora sp. YST-16]|uniref:SDR family oxidoreductase n=1 Tax=unclassified Kitasatospora TaxID=2633591 RepID=UPI0004C45643|nr:MULTISPECIES: SDR family oxidoreductase [unclassified Kitasatospora]WAL73593.1 SDR family oxidoreductase [Kitasatospora sp. YST-16]WNW39650.1 SDR family oxidoreductase [Streptomyces sp. Li-HN-5-13]
MDNPVAVIGGSGRLGRLVAQRLLDRGAPVRAIGRSVQHARRSLPPGALFFEGDVRRPETLREPLAGASALVYCVDPGTADSGPDRPETTAYQGVRNALAAVAEGGHRPRVVLVSQIHATHLAHPLNAYGRVLEWRLAGENAVRDSGLPYTVIRPGWLTDTREAGERVRLEQGDLGSGQVSRPDLAEACVQALLHPAADGVTFEIFNEPGSASPAWSEAFAGLQGDRTPVG